MNLSLTQHNCKQWLNIGVKFFVLNQICADRIVAAFAVALPQQPTSALVRLVQQQTVLWAAAQTFKSVVFSILFCVLIPIRAQLILATPQLERVFSTTLVVPAELVSLALVVSLRVLHSVTLQLLVLRCLVSLRNVLGVFVFRMLQPCAMTTTLAQQTLAVRLLDVSTSVSLAVKARLLVLLLVVFLAPVLSRIVLLRQLPLAATIRTVAVSTLVTNRSVVFTPTTLALLPMWLVRFPTDALALE